jgi:hypothetical protein
MIRARVHVTKRDIAALDGTVAAQSVAPVTPDLAVVRLAASRMFHSVFGMAIAHPRADIVAALPKCRCGDRPAVATDLPRHRGAVGCVRPVISGSIRANGRAGDVFGIFLSQNQ